MRFYYDTEFAEDGHTVGLLSIGIVADDGREYYAVVDDAELLNEAAANPWLRDNVLPSLPVKDYSTRTPATRWGWDAAHPDYGRILTRDVIAREVREFLAPQLLSFTPGAGCELWADYGAYDHVALAQLFGPMIELPPGIPMWTNDLRQEIARLGLADADLPQQEAGQHNALADARHNRAIAQFLDAYQDR